MKKILKTLGLFCMAVAVAFGSFFITKKETKSNIARASSSSTITPPSGEISNPEFDVTYSNVAFTGSNIFLPIERSNNYDIFDYLLARISFETNYLTQSFRFSFTGSKIFVIQNQYSYDGITYNYNIANSIKVGDTNNSYYSVSFSQIFNSSEKFEILLHYDFGGSSFTTPLVIVGSQNIIGYQNGFASAIYSCSIGCESLSNGNFNYIKYTDVDGNFVTFYFRANGSAYALETRTYYFNVDLTDSQQYNQGYNQGLADNQQNIYKNGYEAGKIIGYNNGKTDGIASANNYSFTGLIGAVLNVPVKTFNSLFDFNLLGVNLKSFVLSLFTVAVVILILKWVKGGK